MAAADSAIRTDPSVEPTTGPASRRTRRAGGAKAADGKQATARDGAVAPSAKATRSAKSGAAGAAPGSDEPTELDGADLELDGAPDVTDLEDGDVIDPALDTELETELAVPEVETADDAADDDEDEADDDEAEVDAGPVVRTGLSRAPSSTPAEVRRLRLGRGGVRGAAAGPQGRRAHRVGRLGPGLPQADRQGRAAQRRGGGRARQADRGRPLRGRAAAPGDGGRREGCRRSCAATCAGSSATASAPRTTCSRRTCGSSSRWPSATPAAAWRSWT